MNQKYQKPLLLFGLLFTIVSALLCIVLTYAAFGDLDTYTRMLPYLYDCGMDTMGAMVCAALFFGCIKQDGEGTSSFRALTVMISACFLMNFFLYYIAFMPQHRTLTFAIVLLSKLIDLVMIFFFYRYVKITLSFKGRLASVTNILVPVLMVCEVLILLSNLFYPVTFQINADGFYLSSEVALIEDIFLLTTTVLTVILIIRSDNPRGQKAAALTFLFMPILIYLLVMGEFGNASQYGFCLMSLIIMYCVIFNAKTTKLASTQTELNMATEIQASMLPSIFPAFPQKEEFDLYASMDPAKEVGGDFYDFFMIDDNHLGIVIADVSGKGVPAALFMMISKTVLQNFAKLGLSAAEVLSKANDAICAQNKMQMFVTAWIGILELSTGRMKCSSAGHEYPAICHEGRYELFEDEHGLVLGAMDGVPYEDYEVTLHAGDKIFVYTDGVPEAMNANSELYGMERMVDALNTNPLADPKEALRIVRASVDEFVGTAEQFDDLTMCCLEYKGK